MKIIVLVLICFTLNSKGQTPLSIFFDFDSAILKDNELTKIDSFIQESSPLDSIRVVAHCDSKGSELYNLSLSEKRGSAVVNIIKKSMNADIRISVLAKGESEAHANVKDGFYDRRVDIYIFKELIIEPKEEKSILDIQIEKASIGDRLVLKNIQFYGGSDVPLPEASPALEDLLQTMRNYPALNIAIEGHICCSMDDSEKLSLRRAKAVYDYLVMHGVESQRLQYVGFGRTKPLTEERTEEERSANRRVEIRIVTK